MAYTYTQARPLLTADSALFRLIDGALQIALVMRGTPPFAGMWSLPGGKVGQGEPVAMAARRELREETGVDCDGLRWCGLFDAPGRDPRGWSVSCAHYAVIVTGEMPGPMRGTDVSEARWWAFGDLPSLAFDHDAILARALACITG